MNLFLALSTLMLIIGLVITWWLHSQYHLDVVARPGSLPATDAPLISIIIPARNEARNIRRCVREALSQTYPNLEVIVVDDRSTDSTAHFLAEIASQYQAREANLQVVQGSDLPPGWAGKPHALAQGAQRAQGVWLCFLDADTFAGPELLSAAYAAATAHQADLFTLMTKQELGSFWEKVIQPLVFTALTVGFSPRRVNDPRYPEAVANGQFILVRRTVYDAVGGHAAIRDRIVEDKALAELVKRRGYRLLVGDGSQVARTRMYTRFSEIWEGWTKNIYLGMRDRLGLLLMGAVIGLAATFILPLWLAGGVLWYLASHQPAAVLVALQCIAMWAILIYARVQVIRALGISPWYALTFPLGAAVFTAMMFASAFKVLSGQGVTWKGRRYSG